jgi:enoyl-CoA hydratase/carnithine racemase
MPSRLIIEKHNNLAIVRLNRPEKHNALDFVMFKEIASAIKVLKKDEKLRAIILTGNGEDFCSGLDVKAIMQSKSAAFKLLFKWWPFSANLAQQVSVGWREIPCPVIVAINGRCWGGGLQIALGADFRIASSNSELSIMEGRWGLIPDMGGTVAFRELMRQDHAKLLAMTAQIIPAQEALNLGLITQIADDPLQAAIQLANQLVQQSPDATAAVKKLYNQSWLGYKGLALWRESYYQLKILLGKNQRIAVKRQKQLSQGESLADFDSRRFK